MSVSQGVLASGLAVDLNAMLAKIAAGPATIYDKAMDAEYLATSIGGGNHRMFDGGHTLAGAFEAVRGASAEDTVLQEAFGYMQGLFRDLMTPMGLPLANWDKGTYDQVSGYLQSQFSIPKGWFYDIMSGGLRSRIDRNRPHLRLDPTPEKAPQRLCTAIPGRRDTGTGPDSVRSARGDVCRDSCTVPISRPCTTTHG